MDDRKQFTFYRSFWEAVKTLPKKDRLPVLEAIISYALDGEDPKGLTAGQSAFFLLVKPNLDSSRKKAASGKQGGSKPQANRKQTASKKEREEEDEKENENENEVEEEIENECYKNICGDDGDSARAATESELASVGLLPGEFPGITISAVAKVKNAASVLMKTFADRPATASDCRKVFVRTWRFDEGSLRLNNHAMELLQYAFCEAAAAGHRASWPYVEGIMTNLAYRGITTLEEAYAYDRDRPDKEET